MTYNDIRKELASWTDFVRILKKDISSGQIRNYPNVLNGLIRLSDTIRSLERILDKQEDDIIRRRCKDVKTSTKELQDIISDSENKPTSWIKVNNRLIDFIADLEILSEGLKEKSRQGSKARDTTKKHKPVFSDFKDVEQAVIKQLGKNKLKYQAIIRGSDYNDGGHIKSAIQNLKKAAIIKHERPFYSLYPQHYYLLKSKK